MHLGISYFRTIPVEYLSLFIQIYTHVYIYIYSLSNVIIPHCLLCQPRTIWIDSARVVTVLWHKVLTFVGILDCLSSNWQLNSCLFDGHHNGKHYLL